MQGRDELYWRRPWSIRYNGAVLHFKPLPPWDGAPAEDEQTLIWQVSNLVTQQHQDAATFSAPTTDGRVAWLTVYRDGRVIGGGYHGTTPESYLRLGNPEQDAPIAAPQTATLNCRSRERDETTGVVTFGPPMFQQYLFDRTDFPWSAITPVATVPTSPELDGDPTGAKIDGTAPGFTYRDFRPREGGGYVVTVSPMLVLDGAYYEVSDGKLLAMTDPGVRGSSRLLGQDCRAE